MTDQTKSAKSPLPPFNSLELCLDGEGNPRYNERGILLLADALGIRHFEIQPDRINDLILSWYMVCRQHGEPENPAAEEMIASVDEGSETEGVMKMILDSSD